MPFNRRDDKGDAPMREKPLDVEERKCVYSVQTRTTQELCSGFY